MHIKYFDFTEGKMVTEEHPWAEVKNISGEIIQILTKATKRRSEYGNRPVQNEGDKLEQSEPNQATKTAKTITNHFRGNTSGMRAVGYEELKQHRSKTDCWMALNGIVYDITDYIKKHPGGAVIMDAAGSDGTVLFSKISQLSLNCLDKYHSWVNGAFILKGKEVGVYQYSASGEGQGRFGNTLGV